ncbi:uncharacterized protein V1510DRAFT_414307, partial [Dipodascopsis tothii]|uniref:uncharacterized protein n=1 Tax=Dipodascopsis tothii TaxID=44089 RepID=UPI0034CEB13C
MAGPSFSFSSDKLKATKNSPFAISMKKMAEAEKSASPAASPAPSTPSEEPTAKAASPAQEPEAQTPFKLTSLASNAAPANAFNFSLDAVAKKTTESPFKFNVSASDSEQSPAATPAKKTSSGTETSSPFGGANKPFSMPSANNSAVWTPEKGIKFQSDAKDGETAAPTSGFKFNNPLPAQNGSSPATPAPASAPATSTSPAAGFGSAGGFKAPAVGFSFGSANSDAPKPLSGSVFGSTPAAPAPAAPAAAASATGGQDGAEEETKNDPQINLAEKGPGEEDEDAILEGRTRLYHLNEAKSFVVLGVGVYRVLKHKDTNKCRVILRADGSGRVLLNHPLSKSVHYTVNNNAVRLANVTMIPGQVEPKIDSYLLKVKTVDDAEKLSAVLEENKT